MARQLVQDWGDTSTSYMTLNPANQLFLTKQDRGFIAYRQRMGVALSLGDPVCAPELTKNCVEDFLQICHQKHQTPTFFAIEKNHNIYSELGLQGIQIAEDAYLNLDKLEFRGKNWQDVRTALNRAKREQIVLREFNPGQILSADLISQLRLVSNEWLQCKRLPQLGFTLGGLPTIEDPAVRTFYAQGADGTIHGLVSWLPMYGSRGWALDLMRKRINAMNGIMEFLIAGSALQFQNEGFSRLGLGASPFAPVQIDRPLKPLEKLAAKTTPSLNRIYGFNSLFTFKRKFQPDWKPLYLFYPSQSKLPKISLALATLYFSH